MIFGTNSSLSLANESKTIQSLENEKELIGEKRRGVQEKKVKKQENLSNIEEGKKSLDAEIKEIDFQVTETSHRLREKQEEVRKIRKHVDELSQDIRKLEDTVSKRDELLKERARLMYQNGGNISYFEVLLNSKSFSDFLDRLGAISLIVKQDRNILDAYLEDVRTIERTKMSVEDHLQIMEDNLYELEILAQELEHHQMQKTAIMNKLTEQEQQLHDELEFLDNEDELLASQEISIKKELELNGEHQSKDMIHNSNKATELGFIRPATGKVTSSFGERWGSFHYGVDIGKNGRSEDVPVVAAESGTVIRSYYSASYGNVIFLSHNVNGEIMTTVYAHLENRTVVDGERVEKGHFLGYMGNTGRSFGAHLHFEIHEGPWNINKTNAVDPLIYIVQ